MAIEFRCGDCQKLLRVPAENAGKQAKCPECGHIGQVPAGQAAAHQSFENPSLEDPSESFADAHDSATQSSFDAQSPAESAAENPYAPPRSVNPETRRPIRRLRLPLSSRWKRLGGAILDSLVYGLAMVPGLIAIGWLGDASDALAMMSMIILLGGVSAVAIYNWYLITVSGQSIAKRMLGMRIVTTGGQLPGFVMGVFVRQWIPVIVNQVCSLFSLVDVLFIFGEDRRCLHDYMANTVVVDTNLERPKVESSPAATSEPASTWTCASCGAVVPGAWSKCSTCGERRA